MADDDTTQLQRLLDCLQKGDETARDSLIRHSCDRLQRLTRKMLRSLSEIEEMGADRRRFAGCHAAVAPFVERGQTRIGAGIHRAGRNTDSPVTHRLGPDHFRAKGDAAHHHTDDIRCQRGSLVQNQPDESSEPKTIEQWSNFHEHIECLPAQEREVFNLLWYQGLEQAEAARVLGVDARTIRRRWRSARMMIVEATGGEPPE